MNIVDVTDDRGTTEFLLKEQYSRERLIISKLVPPMISEIISPESRNTPKLVGWIWVAAAAEATKIQALIRGYQQRSKEWEAEEPKEFSKFIEMRMKKKFESGLKQGSSIAVGKGLEWGRLERFTTLSPALSNRSLTPAGSQLQSGNPSICSEAESMSPSPQPPSDLK